MQKIVNVSSECDALCLTFVVVEVLFGCPLFTMFLKNAI